MVFEVLELVWFESRVFVATLEISESRETNLEGPNVLEGEISPGGDF